MRQQVVYGKWEATLAHWHVLQGDYSAGLVAATAPWRPGTEY
jgi:hypothetical protein